MLIKISLILQGYGRLEPAEKLYTDMFVEECKYNFGIILINLVKLLHYDIFIHMKFWSLHGMDT